jgi:1-acyl-sn-glycerol-3-phosphate acyltransferase
MCKTTYAARGDPVNMNNESPLNGKKKRYSIRDLLYDLNGALTALLMSVNTILALPLIVTAVIFKLIPSAYTRKIANAILNRLVAVWISVNSLILDLTTNIKWNVSGLENLSMEKNYLVLSNHQAWSDIIILQKLLNRKVPMLRFFIKQSLIWVPILGLAWWALDYPFMKRHSKAQIAKKPHLAGKDAEATRKACEKYKTIPVSVMNFVEGSRFTEKKRVEKQSNYKNLLNPRPGGTGFVLTSMGDCLSAILNVTIKYGKTRKSFWDFLSGRVKEITVVVETIPVTDELKGDFHNDKEYRERVIKWLNNLWQEKDLLLENI